MGLYGTVPMFKKCNNVVTVPRFKKQNVQIFILLPSNLPTILVCKFQCFLDSTLQQRPTLKKLGK